MTGPSAGRRYIVSEETIPKPRKHGGPPKEMNAWRRSIYYDVSLEVFVRRYGTQDGEAEIGRASIVGVSATMNLWQMCRCVNSPY